MKGDRFFVILVIALICLWAYQNNQLQKQNTELKSKIAEWQEASRPAITARGWWSTGGVVQTPRDITPDVLKYALNPCFTTPVGNMSTEGGGCVNPRSNIVPDVMPIKIILDR